MKTACVKNQRILFWNIKEVMGRNQNCLLSRNIYNRLKKGRSLPFFEHNKSSYHNSDRSSD